MDVPRQPPSRGAPDTAGRVNQKRRTRAAIVTAARDLMAQGITPTVADAAEAALVSRTTAYRYFPTQDSLLLEVTVHDEVDDVEVLVAETVPPDDVPERTLQVLDRFNRHVLDREVQFRAAMRLYTDQWLAAVNEGDTAPVIREGRRLRWLHQVLAPLGDRIGADGIDRLAAALSVVAGSEAMFVLQDVARLDRDQALEVSRWAAGALIDAALADAPTRRRRR